jgi:4-hydroxybenzoate polyprenyltransferase
LRVPDSQRGVAVDTGFHFTISALILQMRPKQWTKNLLVFASSLFAGSILQLDTFIMASSAFISFCFIASTVYIINDIADAEKDRLHPEKCMRPIASGALSIPVAVVFGIILLSISMCIAFRIGTSFLGLLILYLVINLLYSFKMKNIVIIDVMVIAAGFVLRAVSGAIAVGGHLTQWFILCTLMLSLFLALGKRRYELELFQGDKQNHRKVLDYYSTSLLDQLITIVTAITITSYSLYTANDPRDTGNDMMLTIPVVIYGMFRYLYLIHIEKMGGKPEEILLGDKHISITVILYGIIVIFIKSLPT